MGRRLKNKIVYIFLWLIIVVCLISSCAKSETTYSSNAPTLNNESQTTPDNSINDPNKAEGNISLGLYGFDTLNPLLTRNSFIIEYMSLVFNSLIEYDNQCKPVPCLAESWETNDGGVTWSFKIKENIYFHDDSVFTVYDVKNTLEWLKSNNSYYSYCAEDVVSYKIKSQHEIDIILAEADALFPSKMDFPILKSENLGDGFTTPNGTGAYKYKNSSDGKYIFEINKNYFGKFPKIKSIEIQCFDDAEALHESNADVILNFGDNVIKYAKKDGYAVRQYSSSTVCAMVPSENIQLNVRHFINENIDKTLIIHAALADCASEINVLLPQDTYFTKGLYNVGESFDITKPDRIKLIVDKNDEDLVRIAFVVEKQLKALSIECETLVLSSEEYSASLKTGDYDFAFKNYELKFVPDLDDFFSLEGALNYNKFADESVRDLMMSINNSYSEKEISGVVDDASLYSYVSNQTLKLGTRLSEVLPIICLCRKNASISVSDNIKDISLYNFTFWNTMDITSWRK